jgi:hypothetical protein
MYYYFKKRREEYYYRLLKAYQVFDKDCTKNDFAKFLGLKFSGNVYKKKKILYISIYFEEGRNFPLLEKWIENPDIVYDDDEETFSFYGKYKIYKKIFLNLKLFFRIWFLFSKKKERN